MNICRTCGSAFASLFIASLLLATPSSAQKNTAQTTFAKAFEAYQAFDCANALRLFEKGVAQSPDPKAYYFMGNCERWRANRTAAEDAYDRGLKLAPQGSPVRADLESAKASLAVAFDPALQTRLFYEAARRMGIEPPEGLQAAIDPRLVPVHLDWEWELSTTYITTLVSCPYGRGVPTISHVSGGVMTSAQVNRCYEREPDKRSETKTVPAFGLTAHIEDEKWDRKNPVQNGKKPRRDASAWKFVRTTSFTTSRITGPQTSWIAFQETTNKTTYDQESQWQNKNLGDGEIITRCQYRPSANAAVRKLSEGPQLEVLCVTKSGNTTSQYTSYIDLVTGLDLDLEHGSAGMLVTQQISGHLGQVGETIIRVSVSDYGSSGSTTYTFRKTRTR